MVFLNPTGFDRLAMGFSLSVHILLAVLGIAIPALIFISDYLWIKNKDRFYFVLSRRLTTALIVLFAVGTASGMLVAINLLFLWPKFMALVSNVSILPVLIEVFVFFLEAIFLTIYIFYRDAFTFKYARLIIIGIAGAAAAASGGLITVLNSFMNTPVGFNIQNYLQTGNLTNVNPIAVFSSPAAHIEVPHVIATSYFAGGAMIMGYFALMFLLSRNKKQKTYHLKAVKISFALTFIAVFFAIITGILSIESLSHIQPEKYAAIELNLNSISYAPEIIGGIYQNGSIKDYIAIPNLQSILDNGTASGTVPGLNQFPVNTWPPLFIHLLFDGMVLLGFLSGIILLVIAYLYLKNRSIFENRSVIYTLMFVGVIGFGLLQAGWMVDEIGRQPWIIYNVMTVAQAANQSVSIIPLAILIIIIYATILPLTFIALRKIFSRRHLENEL